MTISSNVASILIYAPVGMLCSKLKNAEAHQIVLLFGHAPTCDLVRPVQSSTQCKFLLSPYHERAS